MPRRLALGGVGHDDHPGLLDRALVDPEQAAAAELDQGPLVEHLDLKAGLRADLHRDLGDPGGGQQAGGGRREVAAEHARPSRRQAAGRAGAGLVEGTRGRLEDEGLHGHRAGLRALERVLVAGEQDALDDGRGGLVDRHLGRSRHPGGQRRVLGNRAGEGRGGVAQAGGGQLGRVPGADGDQHRPVRRRERDGLAHLGREPRPGEGVEVDIAEDLGRRLVGEHRDGERVGGDVGARLDDLQAEGRGAGGNGIEIEGLHDNSFVGESVLAGHMLTGAPGPHGMPSRNQATNSTVQVISTHMA